MIGAVTDLVASSTAGSGGVPARRVELVAPGERPVGRGTLAAGRRWRLVRRHVERLARCRCRRPTAERAAAAPVLGDGEVGGCGDVRSGAVHLRALPREPSWPGRPGVVRGDAGCSGLGRRRGCPTGRCVRSKSSTSAGSGVSSSAMTSRASPAGRPRAAPVTLGESPAGPCAAVALVLAVIEGRDARPGSRSSPGRDGDGGVDGGVVDACPGPVPVVERTRPSTGSSAALLRRTPDAWRSHPRSSGSRPR